MALINILDAVPSVYVEESRDFQLFLKLLHCIENGVKFNIDSITNVLDTSAVSDNYLEVLKSKLGYFSTLHIPDDKLRILLAAFPYIVRNKGALKGIRNAVNCFLKLSGVSTSTKIDVYNKENPKTGEQYVVRIGVEAENLDIPVLEDILRYVIPTGYLIDIYTYVGTSIDKTILHNVDTVTFVPVEDTRNSVVRVEPITHNPQQFDNEMQTRTLNTVHILSALEEEQPPNASE